MSLSIREAKPSDAKAIASVHIASWRAAYTGIVAQEWLDNQTIIDREKHWSENLTKPPDRTRKTFLVFNENVLAGFATIGASRHSEYLDYAELWAIYMHPDYFGKGMGRALFNVSCEEALELGYSKMFVNVLRDNPIGRRFYEKLNADVIPQSEGRVILGDREYDDIKYEWKELVR